MTENKLLLVDFYTEDITVTIQESGVGATDEARVEEFLHPNCIEYMNTQEELQISEIEKILSNFITR